MPSADPSLSAAQRIDAACDRFESEWKAGRRPRLDDYLAAAPAADREPLRQALVAVELELSGRGAADTSATHSSVRSEDKRTPVLTVEHTGGSQGPPTAVGRFQIRSVLGSGAFGKVYRAFDPQLGREVALKVPLEAAVKTDTERAQFLKEARAAATINHPNICQIHEVGEHAGRPYIVMALVPGQSLADTLKARKEPLPEKQAALLVRKIALALAAAHNKGIVHRDLKPANVMFDRERKDVIVMDFGLARAPRLGDARATQSGVVMGTPAYMSPEQARGASKDVGPAGDVFSLGVILYELLTGTRPFNGTATEVLGQILHVDPEPPSRRRPGIDRRLEVICLKAMAKDPAQRYATMKEFAMALDACLRAPVPGGPAAETAKADKTRPDGRQPGAETLAGVFAELSADRKQSRAETVAAVEAAIARHRTPRWVFVLVGLLLVGGLTALGGIVFFTRSDTVRVTVELTDVDLADKSLSFFLDEEPISAEALAKPIELKPGDHVLVVKRGNRVVRRMLLTVSGGRSPGIRVRDITPPPPDEKKLSPKEEDRAFAEWLLSIGASVTVSANGGPEKGVTRLADLPPGHFRVTGFNTWGNQQVTDANCDHLIRWLKRTGAESVGLHGTAVGDATVAKLVEIKTLRQRIWLGGTKITNRSLELLATRHDLKAAGFDGTAVTDAGLAHLRSLTELESLSFFATRITDDGVKHLAGLTKLRTLNLGATRVTADGLRHLKGLPIADLNITQTAVRPADLGVLKNSPQLRVLSAGNLSLPDAVVPLLIELKGLETLHLSYNRITDEGLQKFATLKGLKELDVSDNLVTDAGLHKLRKALPGCSILPASKAAADRASDGWQGLELMQTLPHKGIVADALFSADGARLLTSCYLGEPPLPEGAGVHTWDAKTWKPIGEPARLANCARLAQDKTRLVFGINGNGGLGVPSRAELVVWDPIKWARETRFAFDGDNPGGFISLELLPDGRSVLASRYHGDNHATAIFDLATGEYRLKVKGYASCLANDGKTILVGDGADLKQIEIATGKVTRTLRKHTTAVAYVACSPDGRFAASSSQLPANEILLWDLAAPDGAPVLLGKQAAFASCLAFSPNGKSLLSGSASGVLKLWDVVERKEVAAVRADETWVRSVRFSPDGTLAVTGGQGEKAAKVWRLTK